MNLKGLLIALSLMLLPSIASAAEVNHFDGMWQTTVSCAAAETR